MSAQAVTQVSPGDDAEVPTPTNGGNEHAG